MGARPLPARPLDGEPLLTPSLADHVPRDPASAKPWRLGSQIYVAILGGPLAVTLIAALNAQRLRMPGRLVGAIVAIGLAVLAAVALAVAAAQLDGATRLAVQLSGALAFGPMFLLQRPFDRVHRVFSRSEDDDEDHASLWVPGIAAVLVGAITTGVVLAAAEDVL